MNTGYLGPEGTFTEQAALKLFSKKEITPYGSIFDLLNAVENHKLDYGIVPLENSIEGTVNATIDALIFDTNLYIQKLIILPIEQNLMVKKGTKKENITQIYSHSHALAQCKKYLYDNFKDIKTNATNSTAAAAELVASSKDNIGAIAPESAALLYNLEILDSNIQDNNINFTEFALVSKNDTTKNTAGNKTSICFSTTDEPGSLYKLLDIFAIWDVNISKIISRPMRNRPNEYIFYMDIAKNNNEQDIIDALKMVKRKTFFFKNLGSYPILDYRKTK